MQDVLNIVQMLFNKAYVPALAAALWLIVRILKSPSVPIPVERIPAPLRTALVTILGIIAGGLDSFIAGTPWQQALVQGLVAALMAILAQDVVVNWLRGGKEPGAGASVTGAATLLMAWLVGTSAIGCSAANNEKAGRVIEMGAADCVAISRVLQEEGATPEDPRWARIQTVCAGIADLAPLVPSILSARDAGALPAAPVAPSSTAAAELTLDGGAE